MTPSWSNVEPTKKWSVLLQFWPILDLWWTCVGTFANLLIPFQNNLETPSVPAKMPTPQAILRKGGFHIFWGMGWIPMIGWSGMVDTSIPDHKKGRTPAGLRLVELRRSKITSSPLFRTPGRAILARTPLAAAPFTWTWFETTAQMAQVLGFMIRCWRTTNAEELSLPLQRSEVIDSEAPSEWPIWNACWFSSVALRPSIADGSSWSSWSSWVTQSSPGGVLSWLVEKG